MKYSSSTLKVPLNQCALQALSRVASIFTYIEIAALRVLAISEDFVRYVNELGSGHYIIKVLYVFVYLLRNVEGRQGMKKTRRFCCETAH